jgi:integrase
MSRRLSAFLSSSARTGLELDAATASKLAGHANPQVTMRVYTDDFRKATERNAAVLARAAERGFGI